MLRQTWNAYRAWAKLAREIQVEARRWNIVALIFICVAAIFGAIGSVAPVSWSGWAASGAALASALGAYFGKQLVGTGKEAEWMQARAAAEGIKSECYRYAASSGPYALEEAAARAGLLVARTNEIVKRATDMGLVPQDDPVPTSGDKREPTVPLTKDWYRIGRIQDQIDYYSAGRQKDQKAVDILWWVAFLAGVAAVIFGALGAWAQRYAPWIGVMTTIAASIAAFGLIDRRKYLISSYAALRSSLEQILGLDAEAPTDIADLVSSIEDLLQGEHKAWLPQMLSRQHQLPSQQLTRAEI